MTFYERRLKVKTSFLMKRYLFSFSMLLLSGCAQHLKYETTFVAIEENGQDLKKESTESSFETQTFSLVASLGKSGILIVIHNNSSEKIKILWDETLIVDPQGTTHRTLHEGVRYVARYESQPPTIILPSQSHADIIQSADTLHYHPGTYSSGYLYGNARSGYGYTPGFSTPGSWQGGEILKGSVSTVDDLTALQKEMIAKNVYLHLVLEQLNRKQEYKLTFKINDVKIEE